MPCAKRDGMEIKRSTICQSSHFATMALYCPSPVPLGQTTFMRFDLSWRSPDAASETILRFTSLAGGGAVVFDGAGGPAQRTFNGTFSANLAIYGATQSAADNDVRLEVVIRDTVRLTLEIAVQPPAARVERSVLDGLRDELVVAVAATRPASAPQNQVWDQYQAIYADGVAIAAALAADLPMVGVPGLDGVVQNTAFPRDPVHAALAEGRNAFGRHASAAHYHRFVFDCFEGRWRGHWRQDYGCGIFSAVCQDHEWRASQPLSAGSDVLWQEVLLGDDSVPYRSDASGDYLSGPPGRRDRDEYAANLVDAAKGWIVGAVGQGAAPQNGRISARPHVGWYLDSQTLVWLAQEGLDGDRVTYSIFHEHINGDGQGHPQYTILGLELVWNRATNQLEGELKTKGGRYRKLLSGAELTQETQFWLGTVDAAMLGEARYRRRFEMMTPERLLTILNKAPAGPINIYFSRVYNHALGLVALVAATPGPRSSITFIMGSGDAFYDSAVAYFTLNPNTRVFPFAVPAQQNIQSLNDIRRFLDTNRISNLPWGEVNIVVHANPSGFIVAKLMTGDLPNTRSDDLPGASARGFTALADDRLDVRSEIYVRGCEIGENNLYLERLARAFAASTGTDRAMPTVRAPKIVQWYSQITTPVAPNVPPRLDIAEQSLVQKWAVAQKMSIAYNEATVAALFQAKYAASYPDIPWHDGLARTVARYPGDFYREVKNDVAYTYTISYPSVAAHPDLSTDVLRQAYINGVGGLGDWLVTLNHNRGEFDWAVRANGTDLVITGLSRFIYVQRDVIADLAQRFTLPLARQADLAARRLSADLRTAFANGGAVLGDDAELNILWVNNRWLILDRASSTTYLISRTAANLNVQAETPRPVLAVTTPGDAAQIAAHRASVTGAPAELFHVGSGVVGDLDRGFIPGSLVGQFHARGVPLDPNVIVVGQVTGHAWTIYDHGNGRAFTLLRSGNNVTVAVRPVRAHPLANDSVFFGAYQPVNPNPLPPGQNVPFPPT